MQLTKGVGYGIEGILYLARRDDGHPASIRGFRGGFRLARPAGRITLREIVEALRGPIEFHRCLYHPREHGRRHRCHVRRVFRKVQRKVSSILEQTTLEDILQATL